ncbi:MAG: hypothetical protein ACRD0P_18170, partial [Stackebrandtia sp.]
VQTVVHLCTPPENRIEPLEALARLGFRKFLIEKPLAVGERELGELDRIREDHGLDMIVVAQWSTSALGARLTSAAADGDLRTVRFTQHKQRFARTLAGHGHASAFDVEVPHAVGLALQLAGNGRVRTAQCADLVCGKARAARMGGARLSIDHDNGVRTEIHSDLTAPTRQRRVELEFGHRTVVGHFPVSADDPYAQLWTSERRVFHDDALEAFFHRAYAHFAGGPRLDTLSPGREVVRLLEQARRLAFAVPA